MLKIIKLVAAAICVGGAAVFVVLLMPQAVLVMQHLSEIMSNTYEIEGYAEKLIIPFFIWSTASTVLVSLITGDRKDV